ncbi:MAG: hypothetical protein RIE53_00215 [Rhodothermales bacterium]
MKKKTITADEFDRLFDDGHDIWDFLDHDSARQPGLEPETVSLEIPQWMVYWLYLEAERHGTTSAQVIKTYLEERIKLEKAREDEQRKS